MIKAELYNFIKISNLIRQIYLHIAQFEKVQRGEYFQGRHF
jgi:hypothetical protein